MSGGTGGESKALPPIRSVAVIRRVIGPLMRRTGVYVVLEVPGRKSGIPQLVSVFPVNVDGRLYVVALGGNTDWALNLRAAGRAKLTRRGKAQELTGTEVFGDERERVITRYLGPAGPLRRDYNRHPVAADHPVFRLEPIS